MTIYLRCLLVDGMAEFISLFSGADSSFALANPCIWHGFATTMFDAIRSIEVARGFFRPARSVATSFLQHFGDLHGQERNRSAQKMCVLVGKVSRSLMRYLVSIRITREANTIADVTIQKNCYVQQALAAFCSENFSACWEQCDTAKRLLIKMTDCTRRKVSNILFINKK